MFAEIGIRARNTMLPDNLAEPQGIVPNPKAVVDPGLLMLSSKQVADFPRILQIADTGCILDWIRTLVNDRFSIIWVSFHQLLLDFQRMTGKLGPFSTGKKWAERPSGHVYDYKTQVQWFSRYLQYLAKSTGTLLATEQRKPSSLAITFWCGALQVAIDPVRITAADDHYRKFARCLPARQIGRDLALVPPGFVVE